MIFGHCHQWELDKDSWFVDDRIYANCGTWCDEKKPCTFVESQKDKNERIHIVRVMKWKDGKVKELDKQEVSL